MLLYLQITKLYAALLALWKPRQMSQMKQWSHFLALTWAAWPQVPLRISAIILRYASL
jgi:hypothetical protein